MRSMECHALECAGAFSCIAVGFGGLEQRLVETAIVWRGGVTFSAMVARNLKGLASEELVLVLYVLSG